MEHVQNWDKEEGKISEDILTFFIWKIVTHVYYATHFIDTNKLNPHNFLKRQKDGEHHVYPTFSSIASDSPGADWGYGDSVMKE